ncbi:hypothetical protein WMZ97_12280 [Lentibacillus sp. N15]|uniref:hypothetical protein n=1 Tax=Lentibacillus songyuanensis TaxID=3136161 RepID=UPI0031B9F305
MKTILNTVIVIKTGALKLSIGICGIQLCIAVFENHSGKFKIFNNTFKTGENAPESGN